MDECWPAVASGSFDDESAPVLPEWGGGAVVPVAESADDVSSPPDGSSDPTAGPAVPPAVEPERPGYTRAASPEVLLKRHVGVVRSRDTQQVVVGEATQAVHPATVGRALDVEAVRGRVELHSLDRVVGDVAEAERVLSRRRSPGVS
jgi:hypothetical protein